MQNEINLILDMLMSNDFIYAQETISEMITMYNPVETHVITYSLTEKGKMACNINELHPLAIANILDSKLLNKLIPLKLLVC